ncbi:MAG: GNAT family protein [Bacteroidota bacterium]
MSIQIRKYKDSDIPLFYEAVKESLPALSVWLPWAHKDYAVTESINWIQEMVPQIWKEEKGCEFVILNKEGDRVLGGCCLEQLDLKNKRANIGYWVRTSASGKGIATQACFFLLKFGFEELGLEEIRVIPSAENPASVKVAEKLPYLSKERVPNGFQIRDQISDALLYSISRQSYSKQRPI